jgi:integrase
VRKHMGREFFVHKFRQGVSVAEANELSHEQSAVFNAIVAKAREAQERDDWQPEALYRNLIIEAALADLETRITKAHAAMTDDPIIEEDELPQAVSPVVEYAAVVNAWADEKGKLQRSRADRMAKMAALFATLPHTDMTRVTPDDLQRYKESLVAKMTAGTWQPKTVDDHIEMVKAMFRWAKDNRKIATNPATDLLAIGGKTDPRNARQFFDADEIRVILTRANQSDNPIIKWPNWLAAFGGARLSEIIEADTRDIEMTPEGAIFHIRLDHRPATMRLKTDESVRAYPIHSAIMREGFGDYVASLAPGALFPSVPLDSLGQRGNNAQKVINSWLREIGITDARKSFHSWRHTFKTICRGRMEEEIHDAITGHANGSVGRDYGVYPMPKLREAIERLPDPTGS